MTTVRQQGGIIQIHDNRLTRLTKNVSKTKYCIKHVENCKKLLECRRASTQGLKKAAVSFASTLSEHYNVQP